MPVLESPGYEAEPSRRAWATVVICASRKAWWASLPVRLNSVLTQSVVDALICCTSAPPVREVKSETLHAAAVFFPAAPLAGVSIDLAGTGGLPCSP